MIEADYNRSFTMSEGALRRFDLLATADVGEYGVAGLSIQRSAMRPRPIGIRMLERQPLGAQSFVPMERKDWLVVVADNPSPKRLRAFFARGDQGVQINAGVWRHPLLTLHDQDFLVVDRHSPGDALDANHQEEWFAPGDSVELEPV